MAIQSTPQDKAAKAMENFFNALPEEEKDFALRSNPFLRLSMFFECTITDDQFKVTPKKEYFKNGSWREVNK